MKKIKDQQEQPDELSFLKDNFRLNSTGLDNDIVIDIQDAIGREPSLSIVADNVQVDVENGIVTLSGEVSTEQQKDMAGNIATTLAGDDNVNNNLSVIQSDNIE